MSSAGAVFCALAFVASVAAQCPPDQVILNGASLGNGVAVGLNTSGNRTDWLSNDGSALIMQYPSLQSWGVVFFSFGPAGPVGGRQSRDLSGCSNLVLEISGDPGSVDIGVQDWQQAPDGSEPKVTVQVSNQWQTVSIPLSRFARADLKHVYVPAEIVFSGSQVQTVRVRSIKYTGSSAAGPAPQVLPQFAFGGGWYSALYFANTTDQPLSIQLQIIGDDGRPLVVPALSSSSITVDLAPRGSAIVEAPDVGGLAQGYVSVPLPQGVIGYGVFRQSAPGRSDQEAVVPLASASASGNTLIWDDTNYTTAVAIVNPSTTNTLVSVTVRDSSGTVIGTSSVPLAAGNKTAAALRSLPGLAGIVGNRGSAEFSVTSGSVAVLGLRFGGSAFTSIPTTSR
jgi:hypothetical protein